MQLGTGGGSISHAALSAGIGEGFDDDARPQGRKWDDEDDGKYLSTTTLRQQYLDYLVTKMPEIEEQKEARRYYHAAQITEGQRKVLDDRGQPHVVVNAVAKKINRIVGLTERIDSAPKAYPRTPEGEAGADIATETVRYSADANKWKTRKLHTVRRCAVEGIAGIEFKLVEGDKGDPDIEISEILTDDFFYDPTSIFEDFSDALYMGIAKWVSVD